VFKLPNFPSPKSPSHELADFAELTAWKNKTASKREIVAYLSRIDDNNDNIGCEDDEDENSELLDDVMIEIDRRVAACGNGYPFSLEREGTVLRYVEDDSDHGSILYRYLLLSTRLNMTSSKVHDGIDGTLLLEEVAAHTLRNYLGARARSFVFGTAASGNFEAKVNDLCNQLCEGVRFRNPDDASVTKNDDKLDAVAWVPFSDSLASQIIIFCQCKTGTSWSELIHQLQPETFMKRWMEYSFLVTPVRAFCLSEAVDRSRWKSLCAATGIMFDRCRLVDFCGDIEGDLLNRITRWTLAAKESVEFVQRS
jgi:hypothetical protein